MGVKFKRKYKDIIQELMNALQEIDKLYEFIGMKTETWNNLEKENKLNCLKNLTNDIFYGLGVESEFKVGQGMVKYDKNNHLIKVFVGEDYIKTIKLT